MLRRVKNKENKSRLVCLEIRDCGDCFNNNYNLDKRDYECSLTNKTITDDIDWESDILIPLWCPLPKA